MYALGVDIGTTFSAAAIWQSKTVRTVPLGDHSMVVPSAIFVREDGELVVGEAAVRKAVTHPTRVRREFKRRIGDNTPLIVAGEPRRAEELVAELLRWIVRQVTEREGRPPAHVTITCPANWGEHRRGLMLEAAKMAGLGEAGLLQEPVAAAVYYASQERVEPDSYIGVYDLGGGTFDASVLRKTGDGYVVCGEPIGDDRLGGIDFDDAVLAHVAVTLGEAWTNLMMSDKAVLRAVAQVRENAVDAKETLSSHSDADVSVILPGVTTEVRLTRGEFEAAVRMPLQRSVEVFARAVRDAGIEPADLHRVLLIGGSSRIPLVSQLLTQQLHVQVFLDAHPKYAVCLGAAIIAGTRLPADDIAAAPKPTAGDEYDDTGAFVQHVDHERSGLTKSLDVQSLTAVIKSISIDDGQGDEIDDHTSGVDVRTQPMPPLDPEPVDPPWMPTPAADPEPVLDHPRKAQWWATDDRKHTESDEPWYRDSRT